MSDGILINPENRWLASSSSNDFSLFGAQPVPVLTLRPSESGSDGEAPAAPEQTASAPATDDAPVPLALVDTLAPNEAASSSPESSPPQSPLPGAALAGVDAVSAATIGPAASETGSLAPVPAAAPTFAGAPIGPVDTTSPGIAAAPQPTAITAPADAISLAAPLVQPPVQVSDEAAPAETALEAGTIELPPPVLGASDAGQVVTLATALDKAATQIVDGAGEAAAIAPASGAAALPLAAAIGDIVEGAADAATGVFATLGPADPAADTADDDVQDLLGSDPAAGVATLVSLVSVSDVFSVAETDDKAGEAPDDPTSAMLDALAANPQKDSNEADRDADDEEAGGLLPVPAPPAAPSDLLDGLG